MVYKLYLNKAHKQKTQTKYRTDMKIVIPHECTIYDVQETFTLPYHTWMADNLKYQLLIFTRRQGLTFSTVGRKQLVRVSDTWVCIQPPSLLLCTLARFFFDYQFPQVKNEEICVSQDCSEA